MFFVLAAPRPYGDAYTTLHACPWHPMVYPAPNVEASARRQVTESQGYQPHRLRFEHPPSKRTTLSHIIPCLTFLVHWSEIREAAAVAVGWPRLRPAATGDF